MTITYSTQVATEVRGSLARAGKDAGDLAEIISVSTPTARARWRGEKPYTLDELSVIADALGVSVISLVTPRQLAEPAA